MPLEDAAYGLNALLHFILISEGLSQWQSRHCSENFQTGDRISCWLWPTSFFRDSKVDQQLNCQKQATKALTTSSTLPSGTPWRPGASHSVPHVSQGASGPLSGHYKSWKTAEQVHKDRQGTTPVYVKITTDSHLSQEAVLGDSGALWVLLLWGQLLILGNYAP